jgi:hypothetical protein
VNGSRDVVDELMQRERRLSAHDSFRHPGMHGEKVEMSGSQSCPITVDAAGDLDDHTFADQVVQVSRRQ